MQKVIACVLLLAIAALAQQSNFSPSNLVSGVQQGGILPPTSEANNYNVDFYQFYVPENTSSINYMFANTGTSACSYVHLFVRSGGLPCSYHDYSTSAGYICAAVYDPQNGVGSSPVNSLSYPGDDDDLYEFVVDQFIYIGIGRYGDYNTQTCTYTLQVNVNATCAIGQVVVYVSSTNQYCQTYVPATFGAPSIAIAASSVYKLTVAEGTGSISLVLNSTSSSANFYGLNYATPSSGNSVCNNPSGTSVGSFYIYNVICYTPRTGSFYFSVQDTSAFTGSVSFSANVCPAGFGGYNCSFPSNPLNVSALSTPMVMNIPYASIGSFYTTSYLYFDVPGNYTGQTYTITAASTGSGYGYMRRSAYPTDTSYEATVEYNSYPSAFVLSQFDYAVAGRIYFGFDCYSSIGCNVTVAAALPATPTTGSVPNTPTTASFTSAVGLTTAPITSAVGLTTSPITSAGITSARGLTTNGVTTQGITTKSVTSHAVTSAAINQESSDAVNVLPVLASIVFLAIVSLF